MKAKVDSQETRCNDHRQNLVIERLSIKEHRRANIQSQISHYTPSLLTPWHNNSCAGLSAFSTTAESLGWASLSRHAARTTDRQLEKCIACQLWQYNSSYGQSQYPGKHYACLAAERPCTHSICLQAQYEFATCTAHQRQ
jgi:hypothetical protein